MWADLIVRVCLGRRGRVWVGEMAPGRIGLHRDIGTWFMGRYAVVVLTCSGGLNLAGIPSAFL